MTAYEVNRSTTNTLTSTTADTITLTQLWGSVRVTNQHTSNWLYATPGGETAVAEADGTVAIPPGQSRTFKAERAEGTNTVVVGVVGNGNVYTVEGMQGTLDEALDDLTAEVDTLANATSDLAPLDSPTFTGTVSGDTIQVVSASASTTPLTLKAAAAQTANMQEWQDSAGTVLARVTNNGSLYTLSNVLIRTPTGFGATLNVQSGDAGDKGLVVRGAAGQTANLAEFQNSAGGVVARVRNNGTADFWMTDEAGNNGNIRHLQLGAADSAGAGFRTVRVPN